jgi:hypothetical protein
MRYPEVIPLLCPSMDVRWAFLPLAVPGLRTPGKGKLSAFSDPDWRLLNHGRSSQHVELRLSASSASLQSTIATPLTATLKTAGEDDRERLFSEMPRYRREQTSAVGAPNSRTPSAY